MISRYVMKKIQLIIALLMSVSTFAIADDNVQKQATPEKTTENKTTATPSAANSVRVETRPEILGLWGMEIPNNKKCVEYYNFRGSNEVVVNSGKEWSIGLYDYQPSPDNTLERPPALVMQINYDTNQTDCSGRKENQAGEVSQYFVKWQSKNTLNFCASEKGDQCFATLHRVLP